MERTRVEFCLGRNQTKKTKPYKTLAGGGGGNFQQPLMLRRFEAGISYRETLEFHGFRLGKTAEWSLLWERVGKGENRGFQKL